MKPAFAEILRELDDNDIAALDLDRGVKAPTLRKLTDMHRNIAWLVAQGEAGYAIAMATGYSESRISILKADPAFQELVESYRNKLEETREVAAVNIQKKMLAIVADGLDIKHDDLLEGRLDERAQLELLKFAADRSGFGPASKSENTNINFDLADAIAVGRQRAERLSAAVPAAQAGRGIMPILPRPAGDRDE